MYYAELVFKATGTIAIIAGGVIAAATAYHPAMPIIWMVAYLVLVVGVVQYVMGAAEGRLPRQPLSVGMIGGSWLMLNLGHAGVIAGTLAGDFIVLVVGTVFYDAALVWLAASVRRSDRPALRAGYWLLLLAMFVSSLTGIGITLL